MRKLILIILTFTLITPQPTYALRPAASHTTIKAGLGEIQWPERLSAGQLKTSSLPTRNEIIAAVKQYPVGQIPVYDRKTGNIIRHTDSPSVSCSPLKIPGLGTPNDIVWVHNLASGGINFGNRPDYFQMHGYTADMMEHLNRKDMTQLVFLASIDPAFGDRVFEPFANIVARQLNHPDSRIRDSAFAISGLVRLHWTSVTAHKTNVGEIVLRNKQICTTLLNYIKGTSSTREFASAEAGGASLLLETLDYMPEEIQNALIEIIENSTKEGEEGFNPIAASLAIRALRKVKNKTPKTQTVLSKLLLTCKPNLPFINLTAKALSKDLTISESAQHNLIECLKTKGHAPDAILALKNARDKLEETQLAIIRLLDRDDYGIEDKKQAAEALVPCDIVETGPDDRKVLLWGTDKSHRFYPMTSNLTIRAKKLLLDFAENSHDKKVQALAISVLHKSGNLTPGLTQGLIHLLSSEDDDVKFFTIQTAVNRSYNIPLPQQVQDLLVETIEEMTYARLENEDPEAESFPNNYSMSLSALTNMYYKSESTQARIIELIRNTLQNNRLAAPIFDSLRVTWNFYKTENAISFFMNLAPQTLQDGIRPYDGNYQTVMQMARALLLANPPLSASVQLELVNLLEKGKDNAEYLRRFAAFLLKKHDTLTIRARKRLQRIMRWEFTERDTYSQEERENLRYLAAVSLSGLRENMPRDVIDTLTAPLKDLDELRSQENASANIRNCLDNLEGLPLKKQWIHEKLFEILSDYEDDYNIDRAYKLLLDNAQYITDIEFLIEKFTKSHLPYIWVLVGYIIDTYFSEGIKVETKKRLLDFAQTQTVFDYVFIERILYPDNYIMAEPRPADESLQQLHRQCRYDEAKDAYIYLADLAFTLANPPLSTEKGYFFMNREMRAFEANKHIQALRSLRGRLPADETDADEQIRSFIQLLEDVKEALDKKHDDWALITIGSWLPGRLVSIIPYKGKANIISPKLKQQAEKAIREYLWHYQLYVYPNYDLRGQHNSTIEDMWVTMTGRFIPERPQSQGVSRATIPPVPSQRTFQSRDDGLVGPHEIEKRQPSDGITDDVEHESATTKADAQEESVDNAEDELVKDEQLKQQQEQQEQQERQGLTDATEQELRDERLESAQRPISKEDALVLEEVLGMLLYAPYELDSTLTERLNERIEYLPNIQVSPAVCETLEQLMRYYPIRRPEYGRQRGFLSEILSKLNISEGQRGTLESVCATDRLGSESVDAVGLDRIKQQLNDFFQCTDREGWSYNMQLVINGWRYGNVSAKDRDRAKSFLLEKSSGIDAEFGRWMERLLSFFENSRGSTYEDEVLDDIRETIFEFNFRYLIRLGFHFTFKPLKDRFGRQILHFPVWRIIKAEAAYDGSEERTLTLFVERAEKGSRYINTSIRGDEDRFGISRVYLDVCEQCIINIYLPYWNEDLADKSIGELPTDDADLDLWIRCLYSRGIKSFLEKVGKFDDLKPVLGKLSSLLSQRRAVLDSIDLSIVGGGIVYPGLLMEEDQYARFCTPSTCDALNMINTDIEDVLNEGDNRCRAEELIFELSKFASREVEVHETEHTQQDRTPLDTSKMFEYLFVDDCPYMEVTPRGQRKYARELAADLANMISYRGRFLLLAKFLISLESIDSAEFIRSFLFFYELLGTEHMSSFARAGEFQGKRALFINSDTFTLDPILVGLSNIFTAAEDTINEERLSQEARRVYKSIFGQEFIDTRRDKHELVIIEENELAEKGKSIGDLAFSIRGKMQNARKVSDGLGSKDFAIDKAA